MVGASRTLFSQSVAGASRRLNNKFFVAAGYSRAHEITARSGYKLSALTFARTLLSCIASRSQSKSGFHLLLPTHARQANQGIVVVCGCWLGVLSWCLGSAPVQLPPASEA